MNAAERGGNDRDRNRRAEEPPEGPSGLSPEPIQHSQISTTRPRSPEIARRGAAPRVWVLPAANGGAWAVTENMDSSQLSAWAGTPPVILSQNLNSGSSDEIAETPRYVMTERFTQRYHSAIFRLLSRGLLSGVWVLAALAGLRVPGEGKLVAEILLICGVSFLIYTVIRHGSNLLRTQQNVADAKYAFNKAEWKHSVLLDRFAQAMEFRKRTDHAQRGACPDEELLDAGAYRKLIAEGLVTAAELSALGRVVGEQLGLNRPGGAQKGNAELAKDLGVDIETVLFYKDLVSAAGEIGLEHLS